MKGRELKMIQYELDVKPAKVCAEAGISIATLYNVYANKRTVTEDSIAKVRDTLLRMRKHKNKTSA